MVRFLKLLILVPVAVIILAFAIANRTIVSISFDPFSSADASGAAIMAPMFVILFLTLIVGVFIGGVATWFTEGSSRRKARVARDEAERWEDEARRLRDQGPVGAPNRVMIR
ncbi:LapA family protein [Beijerinckia sp. L45]|uniref:LapA family protein n=1 Tax=Beijerinckia sp. L45 TaxID=1641855 RepID=UPI00131C76F2|nr:LapA family protein [Beijerinckia sp. L45]